PGMSDAEILDYGKNFATWANHATGSAEGAVASMGGETLFGPKLTQSKLSRLTTDPAKTIATFMNWERDTPGEKAVAWTRLSGATQFVITNLGFLAVNGGLLWALGQKERPNVTEPFGGDYMNFKGFGLLGYVPGLHTELKTLAQILAVAFAGYKLPKSLQFAQGFVPTKEEFQKTFRTSSKIRAVADIMGGYGLAKLTPSIGRPLEWMVGQNWQGRPLPWSQDPGTPTRPRMTTGEYA